MEAFYRPSNVAVGTSIFALLPAGDCEYRCRAYLVPAFTLRCCFLRIGFVGNIKYCLSQYSEPLPG